jgi:glycosyltransferase involved in cell wall biosynthesis
VIGHPTAEQLTHRAYDAAVFRAALRRATVAAALSQASADQVESLFGREADVLTPGVRSALFPPDLAARKGPARILFSAAAADRRKGLDVAVAAFALVLDARPDARLQVSGEGDAGWAFEALTAETRSRVLSATDFLGAGSIEDVPGRYRAASVTLLPSVDEAFGMALLESLATGTPVVCSPSGGMPEIVDGADVGVVADRMPAAMADAINTALAMAADEETPRRCVEHAKRWDWDANVGPAHVGVYSRVATGHGR